MPTTLQDPPPASMTSLVSGIISDAQELVKQQLALFRAEIKEDLRKTKEASLFLAFGAGVALLGGLVLNLAIPLLLNWAWPQLPLWAAFAIVGSVEAAIGAALIIKAVERFKTVNPLPEQTVEGLKENLRWTTQK